MFVNTRSSKFYANAINEGDLDLDGNPIGGEVCAISGMCPNCGNSIDSHGQNGCKATNSKCNICFREGHFGRVCPNKQQKVATTTTPAQKRFAQKNARRRALDKKVVMNIDESETEFQASESDEDSPKEIAPLNEEESDIDEEMVHAIRKFKKKYGAKKVEKHLRSINVIDEVVNAVTSLPFLHGKIIDKADNVANCNILYDSGSSCSLVSKKYLEKNGLIFDPIEYQTTLQGFQGSKIACHLKGKFKLDLGSGTVTEIELIIIHEKNLNYDLILGFPEQKLMKITVNYDVEPPCFKHNGKDLPIYKINDTFEDGDDHLIQSEPEDNAEGVLALRTETKDQFAVHSSVAITLQGQDIFFLPVFIENDVEGVYRFTLGPELVSKNLRLESSEIIMMTKSGRKKNRVSGVLHVRFDRNKNESLGLSTLSCVGVCTKIEEENNLNIDIEFANFAKIKEKTEEEKIYIYPIKIIPTSTEIKAVKKAQEERKKKWNKESLEAECHEWLANVPKEYKNDVLDLLMQYSSVLLHDLSDLKHGIIDYELRGNIPENFFMACHYKSPSVIMKNLYARMQTYMVRVGLSEQCFFPKAIHPFSILPKKNAKYPTDQASLDQMDDKYLAKNYSRLFRPY